MTVYPKYLWGWEADREITYEISTGYYTTVYLNLTTAMAEETV